MNALRGVSNFPRSILPLLFFFSPLSFTFFFGKAPHTLYLYTTDNVFSLPVDGLREGCWCWRRTQPAIIYDILTERCLCVDREREGGRRGRKKKGKKKKNCLRFLSNKYWQVHQSENWEMLQLFSLFTAHFAVVLTETK